MSVSVWRIGTDTPDYTADDLSGTGAKVGGGRWNRAGTPVLYCASNIALACLETFVHINTRTLPMNRYLVRINIPHEVWATAEVIDHVTAPVGWDAEPQGRVSLDVGKGWIEHAASALLLVPSVVVPEEHNVLINPAHPDAAKITAAKVRKWLYDPRMR